MYSTLWGGAGLRRWPNILRGGPRLVQKTPVSANMEVESTGTGLRGGRPPFLTLTQASPSELFGRGRSYLGLPGWLPPGSTPTLLHSLVKLFPPWRLLTQRGTLDSARYLPLLVYMTLEMPSSRRPRRFRYEFGGQRERRRARQRAARKHNGALYLSDTSPGCLDLYDIMDFEEVESCVDRQKSPNRW